MLRDQTNHDAEQQWAGGEQREGWREVDRRLRSIAKRRAALDHEELALLREAMALRLWRELGMASMREYLERVFGHTPRAAQERLRVAGVLDDLPALEAALVAGELPYSAVREITRVATPATERAWTDACRGKTLREVEELVGERAPGDPPDAPPKPELRKRVVRHEVSAATFALLRQARQILETERGQRLGDDDLVAALCNAVIDGGGGERTVAKHQIAVVTCETCKSAWHDAAGAKVAIGPDDLARAECDAQRIGSLDGAPQRATQDISPKTRRFVFRRDRGRCCVPGCRASRHLELHHIIPREDGGGHHAENITLICDGHHAARHRGQLSITGKAPDLVIAWIHTPVGPPDRFEGAKVRVEAKLALAALGFRKHEASRAVEAAITGGSGDLEAVIRRALAVLHRPE